MNYISGQLIYHHLRVVGGKR